MASYYVKNTGSNGDGLSWANAKTTLAAALALMSAGDTCYVSNNHSETTAATVNLGVPGSEANPSRVLCVDDSAEPPTALATGAVIANTGSTATLDVGSTSQGHTYWHGISFRCGTGTNVSTIYLGTNANVGANFFDSCEFQLLGNAGTYIQLGLGGNYVKMKDCWLKFSSTTQRFRTSNGGLVEWDGGGLLAGGTTPQALFWQSGGGFDVKNLDLSNAGTGIDVIDPSSLSEIAVFENIKMPSGWTGTHLWQAPDLGSRLHFYNVLDSAVNAHARIETIHGWIDSETTVVRTGGASDGTNPISWRMETGQSPNACKFPMATMRSDRFAKWNDTVGSTVTATVEILTDSVSNLQDDEVWLEVEYQSESTSPLGATATDAAADVFATPADQDASSASWTTTGLTNPNKQKLVVTFTPQQKGYIKARVAVALNNAVIYVDPKLTLS